MKNAFSVRYAEIVKLVESGIIGKPQVIVASVNTTLKGEALTDKISSELILCDGIMNSAVIRQKIDFFEKDYAHGYIANEYAGGQLVRYTYTAAPIADSTQITVYGNDGEIRFDSVSDKILTFKQIPDYAGDTVADDIPADGVIDFDGGIIGKTKVSAERIENDLKIAAKFGVKK